MERSPRLRVGLALAIVLLLAGCSGSAVPLGNVAGRITMDGKPLAGALVRFIPETGGRSSQGMTDADGRYTLDYSSRDSRVHLSQGNSYDHHWQP